VVVTAPSGIAFIELFAEDDAACHAWMEYASSDGGVFGGLPKQLVLVENELKARLPDNKKNVRLSLSIHSAGHGSYRVDDFRQLKSKTSIVKLPNGQPGFRGSKLGSSTQEGSRPEQVILASAFIQTKLLTSIKVFHGLAVDGVEFRYEDSSSQLFGKRGGTPHGSEFIFDTRRGEILLGFYVRAGAWIDGIEILTSLGRRSGIYGNSKGGSGHTLIPPRGYSIAGVSGSCGAWMDSFSLIITR
jgi:hypothetical protein